MKWRKDIKESENKTVTASMVAITAIDEIKTEDIYILSIKHVRAWHGKGFMPSVWCGGSGENGEVFYGTDISAYNKALKEGERILEKKIKELEKSMKKYETGKHNT